MADDEHTNIKDFTAGIIFSEIIFRGAPLLVNQTFRLQLATEDDFQAAVGMFVLTRRELPNARNSSK